jgi:undecaprenyl-diphosphatase
MIKRVQHLDWRFSESLGGLRIPPGLSAALRVFVRTGDGWVWLPVVLAIFCYRSRPEFYSIIGRCLLVLLVSLVFYWSVKLSVRRARPFQRRPGIAAQVPPLDQFSFPSGHTMHNLAVGLMVAHYFPLTWWPVAVLPFALGVFRVYFGVHFLSDILAGGVLGICSFEIGKWILA